MRIAAQRPGHSQNEELLDLLRERILIGRLAEGASLNQRALAEGLSVTRAAVAEALRMLYREGLVSRARAGGGMQVAAPGPAALLPAYVVREVLDGLAARLAASHAGPEIQRRCRRLLDEQHAALDVDDRLRYMRANVSFHLTVVDGSANAVLRTQTLTLRATSRSAFLFAGAQMRKAVGEHEAILASVCGGEPEQAERAARAHVRNTIDALQQPSGGLRRTYQEVLHD